MNIPPGRDPVLQVVGFHVDGASPSPMEESMLSATTHGNVPVPSSPTPVIIPPTFQAYDRDRGSASSKESSGQFQSAGGVVAAEGRDSVRRDAPRVTSEGGLPASVKVPASPEQVQRPPAADQVPDAPAASTASDASAATTAGASDSASSEQQQAAPAAVGQAAGQAAAVDAKPAPAPVASDQADADGAGKEGKEKRGGPPADTAPKPQLTRAERRELQEAQRAAKASGQERPAQGGPSAKPPPTPSGGAAGTSGSAPADAAGGAGAPAARADRADRACDPATAKPGGKPSDASLNAPSHAGEHGAGGGGSGTARKAAAGPPNDLFAHLQQYSAVSARTLLARRDASSIHPAVLQLGLRYADGTISGANARCVGMLHTFCQVIQDYKTPPGKSLARDLTQQLNNVIAFLVDCRPLSLSMGNAIKHIKLLISKIDPAKPEAEAKSGIITEISDFINGRIYVADQIITQSAAGKVDAGDVIMTFAYSHVVCEALLRAAADGKPFRVVVVDARPEQEGRSMLTRLLAAGVSCTYVHLSAISYAIREVTKVFLGAAAVMSNGTVMGRAGSAAVAMVAAAVSKPVMICCESYKFHERVQLDSITHNELGDPAVLARVPGRPEVDALSGWSAAEPGHLGLLNLKYDAMPAEYVTMIVTEFGMIPPTSVPVILREYHLARQEQM